MRKLLASLGVAACFFSTPSCLGPNQLFEGIRDWNSEVTESRAVNELIFLGFNILPVYSLAYAADVIVLNSLVWWNISEEPIIEFNAEFQPQGELGF